MAPHATAMSEFEKSVVAVYVGGRPLGAAALGDASQMKNRCESRPAFEPSRSSAWNGWGFDNGNSRFQTSPGLTAADTPKLALKWAFGFPNGNSAYGQPTVTGGRVFAGCGRAAGDDHAGAFARQQLGGSAADTRSTAGQDDDLTGDARATWSVGNRRGKWNGHGCGPFSSLATKWDGCGLDHDLGSGDCRCRPGPVTHITGDHLDVLGGQVGRATRVARQHAYLNSARGQSGDDERAQPARTPGHEHPSGHDVVPGLT